MSDSTEHGPGLIVDNGSYTIKAGFANEEAPRRVCPTVMTLPELDTGRVYVGDDALAKHKRINLLHPIEFGHVTSWENMEKMWHHIFHKELRVAPGFIPHPVFLIENPTGVSMVRPNREKKVQMMFENFGVPAMYASQQELVALYATGFTTGITVNSGYQVTRIVPVYEGYPLPHASQRLDIGGIDLTDYMAELLHAQRQPKDVVRDIKERVSYVSLGVAEESRVFRQDASRERFLTWAVSNRRSRLQIPPALQSGGGDTMGNIQSKSVNTTAFARFDGRTSVRYLQNVKRLISSFSWQV